MLLPRFAFLTASFLAFSALPAAEPTLTLGQRGKLLLEEKFEAAAIPAGWTKNTGELALDHGALRSRELAADKHVAAFRKTVPLQDCVIQVDVKLEGATAFHLGFDPAPGQLKKKGHLFSVILTPDQWSIAESPDKADPKSKNKVHARAKATLPRGEWFTLTLEMKGTEVIAHLPNQPPLRASAPDFKVKKPGLVFRVGSEDQNSAAIDNVRVWELQ